MLVLPFVSLGLSPSYQLCFFLLRSPFFFASKHSLHKCFLIAVNDFDFAFEGNVHKSQAIPDDIFLDEFVERSISGEAGCIVDFEQVGPEGFVKHDV